MSGAGKDKRSATAVDYVKTQQEVGAGLEEQAARAKAEKASEPPEGADPSHDSPKRQGDKLANARDAAAGRGTSK